MTSSGQSGGTWLFSRYDDVAAILRGARVSKDVSRLWPASRVTALNHAMLSKDPPDHTRLRALVTQAFTPARIKNLEPRIGAVVDDLVTVLVEKGSADFISEFALPLPVIIIAELLGVPMADRALFREWSNQVITGTPPTHAGGDGAGSQHQALDALESYFSDLIRERRQHPRGDLISDLIAVRDRDHRLTEPELIGTCILLLIAGHETTANLLGNGLLTLLRFPEQLDLLRRCSELLEPAIEEMLRFESPLQQATFRVASETFSIGGTVIQAGQQVTALIGAANRDPAYFPQPDRFDITRQPNRHLAFGYGIHFCLGAGLARTEARIGFSKLLERLPGIELVSETPVWNGDACLRGLTSLPVLV